MLDNIDQNICCSLAADVEPQHGKTPLLAYRDLALRSVFDTAAPRHADQPHEMRPIRHIIAREYSGIRLDTAVDACGFDHDPQGER